MALSRPVSAISAWCEKHVSFKIEALVRMGIQMVLGLALSLSPLPSAIPPAVASVLGILASTMAITTPKIVFLFGMFSSIICCMVIALVGTTACLAAATVSSGLMVFVFALCAYLFTGLQHGPQQKATSIMSYAMVCIMGMGATASFGLVQNGIRFAITRPPADGDDNLLATLTTDILARVCDAHFSISYGNHSSTSPDVCVGALEELLPDSYEYNYTVPDGAGFGNFAGQTVHLTWDALQKSLDVVLPGGMWIVKGLWTWGGTTNPLAFNQGMLIIICWVLVVLTVGILMPPVRTARSVVRLQLVSSITQSIEVFKEQLLQPMEETSTTQERQESADSPTVKDAISSSAKMDGSEEAHKGPASGEAVAAAADTHADADAAAAAATDAAGSRRAAMRKNMLAFAGGGLAPMTSVEPRCTRAPFDVAWPKLVALVKSVKSLLIVAMGLEMQIWTGGDTHRALVHLEHGLQQLAACATAIRACRDYDGFAPLLLMEDPVEDEEQPVTSRSYMLSLKHVIRAVHSNTIEYLAAYNQKDFGESFDIRPWTKEGLKNYATGWLPYLAGAINIIKRLAVTATLPFRPNRWNWRTALSCAEFTLGLTLIFVMDVYWSDFANYLIQPGLLPPSATNPYVTSYGSPPPSLFSGWTLIAYVFASTPTADGSAKKSLIRAIGTVSGAFSAWVGVIVCSGGSYDPNPDINPAGFVVWLTVTALGFSYWFIREGPLALMGFDPDLGFLPMYFTMTQAICALDIYGGSGTRNDIVVNRLVGNLVGILMALIVSFLPPQIRGNDPGRLKQLVGDMKSTTTDSLRLLLSEQDSASKSEEFDRMRNEYTERAEANYNKAQFYVKVSNLFAKAPLFRMDPKIPQQMTSILMTGSLVYVFMLFAGSYEEETKTGGDKNAVDNHGSVFRKAVQMAIERIEQPLKEVDLMDLKHEMTLNERLLIRMASKIILSLEKHEDVLKQVPVPSKYLTLEPAGEYFNSPADAATTAAAAAISAANAATAAAAAATSAAKAATVAAAAAKADSTAFE